jgi:Family of unknown function (DUF5906)
MKFFALPNTSWQDVSLVEPLTVAPAPYVGADERPTKAEFRKWCNDQGTKHCFYSPVEGLNQNARITVENPPFKMHGLVIDYDTHVGKEGVDAIQRNGEPGMLPRWVTSTFSDYRRLIWEFESPVMVDNEEITDRFIKLLVKKLKVKNLFPGFDESSLKRSQYFERGYDWQEIPNSCPVPMATLEHLFVQAATAKTLRGEGPDIPMDVIAAEVEARWPGRWPGEFAEGARGPLFWIDDGVDRVGAQVGQFGMLCYSERAGKSFVHWGEILGQPFVQKFQAERIGTAAEGLWFDSKHYWKQEEDGAWRARNKDDTTMHLKTQGVSARLLPKSEASDAERVLVTAQKLRTVKAAAPIVHDNREVVMINGERYLNIATTKVIQPADGPCSPLEFPWLHSFFENIWDEPKVAQRDHFMAWLQHWYVSALQGRPQQGQAVIILGPPSSGKTFLNHHILGRIFGGHSDATDFLMGKTNFNKANAECALWAIDDTRGASSWENKAAFSSALKKHVANPVVRVEGKNQNAFEIPWKGRIVITGNTDKESAEIIPALNATIKDKIDGFWWNGWRAPFLPAGGSEEVVAKEIPFFLRWLVNWKAPDYVLSDNPRYKVKSYHHPKILEHAHDASPAARLTELLDLWIEGLPAENKKERIWLTPSKLRKHLSADPSARDGLKEFSRNRMSAALEALEYETRLHNHMTEYMIYEPPD